jgi:acetyltransferase-like isoleucine patch superfamily enzyme
MKHILIKVLSFPFYISIRIFSVFRYSFNRIYFYGKASGKIKNLSPAVLLDGDIIVTGTANIEIGNKTRIGNDVEFETTGRGKIVIGENVRINRGVTICSYSEVKIGKNSLIGEFVSIRDANHGIKKSSIIKDQPHESKPIQIGEDAWIGRGVCILSGVTIGEGAVIGANSVVTKDIPPYSIAVGTPAKTIRQRQ